MSRSVARALALAAGLLAAPAMAETFHVAETTRTIVPAHARDWRGAATHALVLRIWYPVAASLPDRPHDIGPPGRPLLAGHRLVDGTPPPARGRLPLILLSHGTGGSADSIDWLGAGLAEAGYVVVGINHPGNTSLEPYTREGFKLWWERAADVSDALTGMEADPRFADAIDRRRVGAAGFSLGGYTVLELAGARTVPGRLEAFCASPQADAICHPPELDAVAGGAGVPLADSEETRASLARAANSFRDTRIRAVFAVAPALGEAFDAASFADVRIPVSMMAGSADDIAPVATNIERFARFMPAARVRLVPDAGHYSFLDVCRPALQAAQPRLCTDRPGLDRGAAHEAVLKQARAFFASALAPDAGEPK